MSAQEQPPGQQQPDDGSLSGAAELAVAALLLRGLAMPALAAKYRKQASVAPSKEGVRRWLQNANTAKKMWDDKYAPPPPAREPIVRKITDPDGNEFEIEEFDEFDDSPSEGKKHGIKIKPALGANRGKNFFQRSSEGPEVFTQVMSHPATLAHEMGHAEMYARGNQLNGAASDLISQIQENKIRHFPSHHLAKGGMTTNWRHALIPAAGAIAGLGAGAFLGDNGAIVGGLVGAATGLPLLAVEAEAWRRGAEYAKAMGVSKRRYAAQAVIPLLSYASIPLANAALGAISAELAADFSRGQAGR